MELNQTNPEWHIKLQNSEKSKSLFLHNVILSQDNMKCLQNYNWSHLLAISLTYTSMGSIGLSYIQTMNCSSTITSINLASNQIDSLGLKLLTQIAWPQLKQLSLYNNVIQKVDWKAQSLQNLKNLNLSYNKIVQFPSEIWKIKNLGSLILNKNLIQSIPESIDNNSKLLHLHLSDNKLNEQSISTVIKLRSRKCRVDV